MIVLRETKKNEKLILCYEDGYELARKKKIIYQVYTEGIKLAGKPLTYDYGHTRGIEITVTKSGFHIKTGRTVMKGMDSILDDPLFKDAIKKAVLIQLIKYGKSSLQKLTAKVNDESQIIYDMKVAKIPLVYTLCGEKLARPIPDNWSVPQFESILKTTKTTKRKANRLDAALYAYLLAKSKTYETERFIYLWMALNGLYGHIAEIAKEHTEENNVKKWIDREYAQLKFLAMFFDLPYHSPEGEDNERRLIHQLEHLIGKLKSEEFPVFIAALENNGTNDLIDSIKTLLEPCGIENTMSIYGLLLIWFPYQIRCKYFHGEKAIPLLCFENEAPLPALRVVNLLLEKFLDNNLADWFDKNRLDEALIPKIEQYIMSCHCNSNKRLISCIVDGKDLR